MAPTFFEAQPGDRLETLEFAPLTRHQFALYCGGSGDHNPLHTDSDFARSQGGLDDVIGHGMLSMALAGRYLTGLAPLHAIRAFSARFVGKTNPGDRLTCVGTIQERTVTLSMLDIILQIAMTASPRRPILTATAHIRLDLTTLRGNAQ